MSATPRHYPDDIPALRKLVCNLAFQRAILVTIVAAGVLVGLQTYETLEARFGDWFALLDAVIIGIFVLEAVLKMAAHGRRFDRYFRSPWNVFDFAIVVLCLAPINGEFAAVARLARVLRTLRLISTAPRLQVLTGALLKSIPSMFYVGMLLFLLFYVYAVMGVYLWRDNDPAHFGSLQASMLTLFRVVTLEDWTDVMYTQMLGSDVYATEIAANAVAPKASPIVGALYFVSFVMIGTMIMLNLFIGVIMNSMHEAQAERERRLRAAHIAEFGAPTIADELAFVEHEVEALRDRLKELHAKAVAAERPRRIDRRAR